MLTREENELLTRTGRGTPMGDLMRRYWIPALFSSQVSEPDCPPVRVKLLGEELVAFRDSAGRLGLVEEHCAHRGASLFFGRNEECGLRCVYHGWKFDVNGQCLDMPSEPPESSFKEKIKLTAYPVRERGGVVWAYMGPAEMQPGLPELEWTFVPDSHRFMTKRLQECNWLQAMEGGIDSVHVPNLHFGKPGVTPRVPRYELTPTDYGFMVAHRHEEGDVTHWNVKHWLMPFYKTIATFLESDAPIGGGHAWVPIDDENCIAYSFDWCSTRPLTEKELEFYNSWEWIHTENLPGSDRPVLNKSNDYLMDRSLQRSGNSYTGIKGLGAQDAAMQESMGPIQDRTREHLGTSDIAIITVRRHLLQAVSAFQRGATPPGLDPAGYRVRSAKFTSPKGLSLKEVAETSAASLLRI